MTGLLARLIDVDMIVYTHNVETIISVHSIGKIPSTVPSSHALSNDDADDSS